MVKGLAWQQLTADCAIEFADELADLLDLATPASVSFPAVSDGRCHIQALFPGEQSLDHLIQVLAAVGDCRLQVDTVEEKNWLVVSQEAWSPQDLGNGVWVGPGWCDPPTSVQVYLRIDPGQAFGTGRHPSTRLCLRWLVEHATELPPTVIDYGCGSGVLAIAAARLGASQVIATDIDPLALAATADNAYDNGVPDRIVVVPPAELIRKPAELVFANILLRPLLVLAPRFRELVVPDGRIVLSGILFEQVEHIREKYQEAFDFASPVVEDGWALLVGRRRAVGG